MSTSPATTALGAIHVSGCVHGVLFNKLSLGRCLLYHSSSIFSSLTAGPLGALKKLIDLVCCRAAALAEEAGRRRPSRLAPACLSMMDATDFLLGLPGCSDQVWEPSPSVLQSEFLGLSRLVRSGNIPKVQTPNDKPLVQPNYGSTQSHKDTSHESAFYYCSISCTGVRNCPNSEIGTGISHLLI